MFSKKLHIALSEKYSKQAAAPKRNSITIFMSKPPITTPP